MGLGFGGGGSGGGGGVAENTAVTFKSLTLASPTVNTPLIAGSGFSLTGGNAQSLVDLAGTWNTSGTPTALKLNITDTASNSASLLMDIQKGGTTVFAVGKNNSITLGSGFSINGSSYLNLNIGGANKFGIGGATNISYQTLSISSGFGLLIGNNVELYGSAANTLQLGTNHATAAVDQTIKGPNTTTGVGGGLILMPGTGSVSGGACILQDSTGDPIVEVGDGTLGFFGVQPVGQQASISDGSTLLTFSGSDTVDLAALESEINDMNGRINTLIALSRTFGFIAI